MTAVRPTQVTGRAPRAATDAAAVPAPDPAADPATATGVAPRIALEIRDLRVRLGSGRRRSEVLRGIDMRVRAGEFLGVIGPNGSGKSTMLRALAGLVPSTGSATLASGRRPRPTDLAIMPQTPVLPPGMTVAEYVLIGRTPHLPWLRRESDRDHRIVADVLRRLDLEAYAERAVTTLSGGEAQRVALARALSQQVPVLLLDEPTSSLDIGAQAGVLDLVQSLRRTDGLTVVVAVHDLGVAARYADRLLLLRQGRAVTLGAPADVLREDVLSQVYGVPLRVCDVGGELVVLPRRDRDR